MNNTNIGTTICIRLEYKGSAWVSLGVQVGDEVKVVVEEAHPRDDVLIFKEAQAI